MECLRVNLGERSYCIHIGEGLLGGFGELLRTVFTDGKIAVVTDSNVAPFYAGRLLAALGGYEATLITIPAGEASKSHEMLLYIYGELLRLGITRSDMLVALGGGVVGDLAGFAAATYLRGIRFAQIPTTLLSQVDSSVGGKVAVNLPEGKNLVGAFAQPVLVAADTATLSTLPPRVFSDGMAEVIKYGCIADPALFELLASGDYGLSGVIRRCCDIKRGFVERDEMDTGERMALNFGHTFGHAVEKRFNYERYTHGEAVAIGMVIACEAGEIIGVTPWGTATEVERVLRGAGLPTRLDFPVSGLFADMLNDKKRGGDSLSVILLEEIGRYTVKKLAFGELRGILEHIDKNTEE